MAAQGVQLGHHGVRLGMCVFPQLLLTKSPGSQRNKTILSLNWWWTYFSRERKQQLGWLKKPERCRFQYIRHPCWDLPPLSDERQKTHSIKHKNRDINGCNKEKQQSSKIILVSCNHMIAIPFQWRAHIEMMHYFHGDSVWRLHNHDPCCSTDGYCWGFKDVKRDLRFGLIYISS